MCRKVTELKILTCEHLTKDLNRWPSTKKVCPHQEIIQNEAGGPPVYRFPIAFLQDDFWGNEWWSSWYLYEEMDEQRKHKDE